MRSRLRRMTTGKAIPTPLDILGIGNATQWFWLDFTDPTSWAQNSDGTVAATSLGDPVGFVRDKSGQGYNPTMTVASSRPTHGRMPKGGVRNRLTYTENMTNAAWTKVDVTAVNANTAAETATTAAHYVYCTLLPVVAGLTYTQSVTLKKGSGPSAPDFMQITFGTTAFGASQFATVNVSSGEVVSVAGGATCTSSPDPNIEGGWRFRYTATAVSGGNSGGAYVIFCDNNSAATRLPSYLGSSNADCQVYFAQFELGSSASPYQKVAQAYDVTEAGVPSISCLWFDAVDDYLGMTSSGAGLLRNCSRFTLAAGATFTATISASRALFLASTASDSGSARLTLQGQATGNLAVRGRRLDSDSIATANTSQNVYDAGAFATVVSYETAVAELRRDSVQVAINNSFQTPGNTADSDSAGIHIGRLSTAYFGGFMTGVVGVRNTALTATQLVQLERFLMNQIGVTA